MKTHFEILIDASGSMGRDVKPKKRETYLLPDGSSRTDLVKSILLNNIIPNLNFADNIRLSIFRTDLQKKVDGSFKVNAQNQELKKEDNYSQIYSGKANSVELQNMVKQLKDPELGSTPLFGALIRPLTKYKNSNVVIIVISDGVASDQVEFDKLILQYINKYVSDCTIHFIGISQNDAALKKSKNLSEKTGGIYTNLKAMDYDKHTLNVLLSKLNTTIAGNALKENIRETQTIATSNNMVAPKVEDVKADTEKTAIIPDNDLLEKQVHKNTASLEYISGQLNNILTLLQSKNHIEEEVMVVENEIHNQRIGRLAESFLYEELQELFKNTSTKITWLNEVNERGKPYDFVIEKENETFYYECKGTASGLNEFQLTKNEWNFYLDNKGKYRLCFVSEVDTSPTYIRFMDLIDEMNQKKLTPCSTQDKAYKANRIVFQIDKTI